jgi:hypothetical protein
MIKKAIRATTAHPKQPQPNAAPVDDGEVEDTLA